jgi:hypothetical protein
VVESDPVSFAIDGDFRGSASGSAHADPLPINSSCEFSPYLDRVTYTSPAETAAVFRCHRNDGRAARNSRPRL